MAIEGIEKLYALKEAAQLMSVNVWTLRNWTREGKIRVLRTPGGHRRIPQSAIEEMLGIKRRRTGRPRVAVYARVSTKKQADSGNLTRQKERLFDHAVAKGYDVVASFSEVASGVNERRRELAKVLDLARDCEIELLLVEYRDRLARFGYMYLERMLADSGVKIEVLEENERGATEELAEDLLAIISSFAARLYGSRGGKAVKKMLEDLLGGQFQPSELITQNS